MKSNQNDEDMNWYLEQTYNPDFDIEDYLFEETN